MTATTQHTLAPERHPDFWIPTLIRLKAEPAAMASPPSDATMQHLAPNSVFRAACIVPANDANDPAVADAGAAEANDVREFSAAREAELAMEASTEFEAEREADRSAQREAELVPGAPAKPDEPAGAAAELAGKPAVRRETSPPGARGRRGAAILTALALAATATAILAVTGLAGRPVNAIGSKHGLSARTSADASGPVTESPSAGEHPLIVPRAEGIPPGAAAPALIIRDPAPADCTIVPPAIRIEAVAAETAPPTPALTPPVTSSGANPGPGDTTAGPGTLLPVAEGADHPVIATATAVEAEGSTSARRPRKRPPRGQAHHQPTGDAGDALVGTQVLSTSRDPVDVPVDVLASDLAGAP